MYNCIVGMNDITYFCSFDLPHSVDQCKIELFPMKWDIEEVRHCCIVDIKSTIVFDE